MKLAKLTAGTLLSTLCSVVACSSTNETHDTQALNSVEHGREISAVQRETTPFERLKIQKTLTPGKTYLAFMRDEIKPGIDSQYEAIMKFERQYPNQYSKWQELLVSEGTGVAVRIDDRNYFFNVGYTDTPTDQEVHSRDKKVDSDERDAKSGRSYGVGPTRRQSDPSYPFYLKELQDYLKSEPQNATKFYRALVLVLIDCDTSGWRDLSPAGQVVATDYLAIYTAELFRHMVMDLRPHSHPWEIDMSGITFVAPFSVATGKIMSDGKLVDSELKGWIGRNETTGSSGVGFTRGDRQALTGQITKFIKNGDGASAIKAINMAIGQTEGDDVIQEFFEFLNAKDLHGATLTRTQVKALSENLPYVVTASQAQAQSIKNYVLQ